MSERLHVATNQYPWFTFYRRDDRDFAKNLDAGLAEVAGAGLDGFEPLAEKPEDIDRLGPLLAKHKLAMRSLYVNSTLHLADKVDASIAQVLAIAEKAKPLGAKLIVTNPTPIRWGGPENKDDEQLKTQAKALNRLGRKLADMGLTLAYHNHDIELRHAARELHHMLLGTDPELITLCLDVHWMYRGAGNSQVALFDIAKLYLKRVTELHLRQSRAGVWNEAFGPGDIDYPALAKLLLDAGRRPHLVLEQSVEKESLKTQDAAAAHAEGVKYARAVFAKFG